jgi:hypothetical protein
MSLWLSLVSVKPSKWIHTFIPLRLKVCTIPEVSSCQHFYYTDTKYLATFELCQSLQKPYLPSSNFILFFLLTELKFCFGTNSLNSHCKASNYLAIIMPKLHYLFIYSLRLISRSSLNSALYKVSEHEENVDKFFDTRKHKWPSVRVLNFF